MFGRVIFGRIFASEIWGRFICGEGFFFGVGGGRLFSEFFGTLASRQVMGISR